MKPELFDPTFQNYKSLVYFFVPIVGILTHIFYLHKKQTLFWCLQCTHYSNKKNNGRNETSSSAMTLIQHNH